MVVEWMGGYAADGLPKGWLYYARRFSARPGVKRRKDRTRGDNFEEGGLRFRATVRKNCGNIFGRVE